MNEKISTVVHPISMKIHNFLITEDEDLIEGEQRQRRFKENNASPEGQCIKPEVAVPTGRGRGRPPRRIRIVEQGTASSAQASSGARRGSGRSRGVG
ncbi:hypothetical protein Tco_0210806 [Tanacetum coccineum]